MNMLLRFEVSTFEVKAVLDGLRLQGFAAEAAPRLTTQDVQLVCVESDPWDVETLRDAVRLMSDGATEVN